MQLISWQYCKNLNDINYAIEQQPRDWLGITADNIISITYDPNQGCYVVFWNVEETKV